MQNRAEVREFLTTRRGRITPASVHLAMNGNRRVAGLRRSEVAMLAGVSIEYYSRIERGDLTGVSERVLDAVAAALQFDEAERGHLADLARAANASPVRGARRQLRVASVRPSVQYVIDALETCPAVVRNARLDLIGGNRLWHALYASMYEGPVRPANLARFAFLDRERSEAFYPDWHGAADICVEVLRVEAGRDPQDRNLQDLIGELSTRSDDFRRKWGAHNVRRHSTGVKQFHHAAVGRLELTYEEMSLPNDRELSLLVYSPEPGSPSEGALRLLGSLSVTQRHQEASAP